MRPQPPDVSGDRPTAGSGVVQRLFGAVVRPFQQFLRMQAASGILLLGCAVSALIWANSHEESYRALLDQVISLGVGEYSVRFTVLELINDGLMAIFFVVVGMEIKRELVLGELNTVARATLPAIAAVGGMLVPAAIFVAFTWGTPGQHGWGIPMATDIAFCIGALTLLKDRVPRALLVFITALAIFDDIGGILVIALFYGHGLSLAWLLIAALLGGGLAVMNRSRVISGFAYAAIGFGLWYSLHHAGIHATIAGVVLGLAIPARARRSSREVLGELAHHVSQLVAKPADEELDAAEVLMIEENLEDMEAPLTRFVHLLHPLVAFGVMPVFALANSGIDLSGTGIDGLLEPVALGAALGLFVGKQLGIFAFTWAATRAGVSAIPGGASHMQLFGVSVIAGIGFTVALFIATLAYHDAPELLAQAKLGIVVGSVAAGIVGFGLLRFFVPLPRSNQPDEEAAS